MQPAIDAYGCDTRYARNPRQQVLEERHPPRGIRISLRREGNSQRQKLLRLVSEVGVLHGHERTNEEARSSEEHQRQRDLRHDE